MKLYPLVLALAGAGLAGVNALPLRVTIVSSTNQIGPAAKFFDNPPPPSVRSGDGLYRIQVIPPIEPHRRPCHSMSKTAMDISNRFRKLFGFEPIKTHTAVEHHPVHNHASPVPVDSITFSPAPPVHDDGEVHIMPFPPVPVEYLENASALPVHHHSHHRHHRLRDASFVKRLSHALMMLGSWEGKAVAFVLGCGIGVVLRMIYVLVVVTYRMFRGPAQPGEDDVDEEETEVLLVAAPPEYSKDEKVAL
ncbi:hypothetical protein BDM02DRAFT_3259616 [Thelephora ganbajun]|uniref:Uncharacterized protein n=1 Tax=Thelephora ganbajun TaxID=370292 RepID=A0ACB6ZMN3_THEGA|nr:hypothetical protein BDM02DRAFT_3259616 [Thelephora ganbajun]